MDCGIELSHCYPNAGVAKRAGVQPFQIVPRSALFCSCCTRACLGERCLWSWAAQALRLGGDCKSGKDEAFGNACIAPYWMNWPMQTNSISAECRLIRDIFRQKGGSRGWARPGQSCKTRLQTPCSGRSARYSFGRRRHSGQSERSSVAADHARCHPDHSYRAAGTAQTIPRKAPCRQSLRQCRLARGLPSAGHPRSHCTQKHRALGSLGTTPLGRGAHHGLAHPLSPPPRALRALKRTASRIPHPRLHRHLLALSLIWF